MDRIDIQIQMLRAAEIQFRLAVAVRLATADRAQPLDLPSVWTYGQHSVEFHEIALTPEGADLAALCLERSATYLMAIQIQEALTEFANQKAREHPQPEVRSAFEIARLVRNGFAHHPMRPVWDIDKHCGNSTYAVEGIIALDTTNLHGKPFDWRDYGGPLALLRLSEFVRTKILGDEGTFGSNRERESVPPPLNEYIQQGSVVLKKLK
ncbi:MAG: hypothetical protein ACLQG3_17910 [Terracidiphilus sp.]